jgi:L-threonylcarbamoyladenylate synthase
MAQVLSVSLEKPESRSLARAAEIIRKGGVVVYPTETLYGIGADAFNADAIGKIYTVKGRGETKPILVIIDSPMMLRLLADEIPGPAQLLMQQFWPGPLTLVFKASTRVPKEVTGGTGTIGVRIPSSLLCVKLSGLCGCPLTSTSANISGGPVCRTIQEIQAVLHEGVDLYLDAGELPDTMPSTVVDVSGDVPRVLREGAVSSELIREVIPQIER